MDIKNFLEKESKFLNVVGIFAVFVTLVLQIPFNQLEQKTIQYGDQERTYTIPSAVNQNIRFIQCSVIFLFILLATMFCVQCFKTSLGSSSYTFQIFAMITLQSLLLLLIYFFRKYDYLIFFILSPIIFFIMSILGMKAQDYLISKFRMSSFVVTLFALFLLYLTYFNPFDITFKIAIFLFGIFASVLDESIVDTVIDYLLDVVRLILNGISLGVLISTLINHKKMLNYKNQ